MSLRLPCGVLSLAEPSTETVTITICSVCPLTHLVITGLWRVRQSVWRHWSSANAHCSSRSSSQSSSSSSSGWCSKPRSRNARVLHEGGKVPQCCGVEAVSNTNLLGCRSRYVVLCDLLHNSLCPSGVTPGQQSFLSSWQKSSGQKSLSDNGIPLYHTVVTAC